MQLQPNYPLNIFPIELAQSFPFEVSDLHFQGDQEITDLHIHNILELGYCYEGNGIFVVENKVLPFNPGCINVITSSEMHLAQSTPGTVSKWRWVYIDLQRLLYPIFHNSKLGDVAHFSGPDFANIITTATHPKICRLVKEMIGVYLQKESFYQEEIVSLVCLFITKLHKAYPIAHGRTSWQGIPARDSEVLERIQKAIVYITNNYYQPIKLAELASLCHLSPNHFRRLFHQATGKSPIQYLNHVRITVASTELLNSKKPISEIAFNCGFYSLSSFNRQFKTQTGISPRQFRQQA